MNDLTKPVLSEQLAAHGAEVYAYGSRLESILTAIVKVEAQLDRDLTFSDDDHSLLDGALVRAGLTMHHTTIERVIDSVGCARSNSEHDCYCGKEDI